MKYRCPTCKAIAEIDKGRKSITIEFQPPTFPKPDRTMRIGMQAAVSFPSHADCEFLKPVDKINLSALKQVDVKFVHRRTE